MKRMVCILQLLILLSTAALGEGVPLPMSGLLYELMTAAAKYDDEDVNALRKLFE